MNKQKSTISKAEARELAEMLSIFQKLSGWERIAVQYYIKGMMDAQASNIEIFPPPPTTAAAHAIQGRTRRCHRPYPQH